MPFYLLLAMQASGMVIDYFGAKNQAQMMKMGMKLQQAGIAANIEQNRLETEESSLAAMKDLRQILGSQIAAMAARGTATYAGSAVSLLNESQANFNADERTRRMNSLGRENQLRAGAALSRLQYSSETSKLWQGFASRTLNRFPTSFSGWNPSGTGASQGFGLTSIGAG